MFNSKKSIFNFSKENYCPNCGRRYDDGDKYCRFCGFSLKDANKKKYTDIQILYGPPDWNDD